MATKIQQSLLGASAKIFRTLIKILVRNGIGVEVITKQIEHLYQDVIREQGDNARRFDKLLHSLAEKEPTTDIRAGTIAASQLEFNHIGRVISGWTNDPKFTYAGEPRRLKLFGEDNNFQSLVETYGGGIPFSTMLSILETSEIISIVDNEIKLLQKRYIPFDGSSDKFDILGADVSELITTIDNNLESPKRQQRFQRKVSNICISPVTVKHFKKFASVKSQNLLEELDQYLSQHEVPPENPDDKGSYISVGIYLYEETIK